LDLSSPMTLYFSLPLRLTLPLVSFSGALCLAFCLSLFFTWALQRNLNSSFRVSKSCHLLH
jgi:hypothetical protein